MVKTYSSQQIGGNTMAESRRSILSVAAALSALGTTLPATASATSATEPVQTDKNAEAQTVQPNMIVSTGQDLLGFTVKQNSDGTVVAGHTSHASHASHASHYSSR
jgi:hypothetical protein